MNASELNTIAKRMVARGKGIIAADESNTSCEKRFTAVGIPCTPETRQAYREMLLAAPGLEEYISGVILFNETFHQKVGNATFPEMLTAKGILPGIKVDGGLKDLDGHPGEKITVGLDGLAERLAQYRALGARFAKWRAVITIGDPPAGGPSQECIEANADSLAKYAKLCQEADIVPMVEPEVLIDGDHTIEQCFNATEAIQKALFAHCKMQGVELSGLILKSSMVIAGKASQKQSTTQEVGEWTLKSLKSNVPEEVAGIVFLSGGQGDEQATENLNTMVQMGPADGGGPLTFSYSRALQNAPLSIWSKDMQNNVAPARAALLFRAQMNSLASLGQYSPEMEKTRPY